MWAVISSSFLSRTHPEWNISALVRDEEKAKQLAKVYPSLRVVLGDLSSSDIIDEEVKQADIVYQIANCDHTGAAATIAKGAAYHTAERPCWVIHTSGTASLIFEDTRAQTHGIERTKEYNDWDGVDEQRNLPDDAYHRDVEKIIIAAGQVDPARVKTAIVSPPNVYGPGRGVFNQTSMQAYYLSRKVLKRKKGIIVGEGKNVWSEVHVQDLSDLFLLLGEATAAGEGDATWGDDGYYLCENGESVWGEVERAIARAAYEKGYIPSPEVEPLGEDEVVPTNLGYGLYLWGSNCRVRSIRAKRLLGWKPFRPPMMELIEDIVEGEAQALKKE